MSKRILVTGAAGFIGSHVAEVLLGRGDTVVALDNLNDYYDPARKRENIRELTASGGGDRLSFIEGDIRDRNCLAAIFDGPRIDGIAHLAAMAGVRASVDDPQLYLDVNLSGTLNLLDAAAGRLGAGRLGSNRFVDTGAAFVLASTSSVYGAAGERTFVETDKCDRPLAPYPASKRAAEMLAHSYHHLYGFNVTALRFFTVYGPRGRPDMMAYKVLDSIFFDRDVPLYNEGQMHRDWTYVEDVAAGVVAALDRQLGFEAINIGRGEPVLLADFVSRIEDLAGKKANLRPAEMPAADIAYTKADISKARRLLGYDPKVSVVAGVEKFWAWYQSAVLDKR